MLSKNQIDIIIATLKPYKPQKIGVFGSYARGENTDDSDIDILYTFGAKYSLFDLVGLQMELQDKLHKAIDLVEFTSIPPKLKERIMNDVKIVYETPIN